MNKPLPTLMEEICNQHHINSRDRISSLVYYFWKSLSNPRCSTTSKTKDETWSIQNFGLEFRGRFHLTAIDCFQINQGCKPETLSLRDLVKSNSFPRSQRLDLQAHVHGRLKSAGRKAANQFCKHFGWMPMRVHLFFYHKIHLHSFSYPRWAEELGFRITQPPPTNPCHAQTCSGRPQTLQSCCKTKCM